MVPTDTKQRPLFDVRRFLLQPYPRGSFYDVLERLGGIVVRASDFPESDPRDGGADAYCPVMLSKLVLLQRHHGWPDRETVHRARCDMAVKACLGLGLDQAGPSQPTLCRHRNKMQHKQLEQLYMERMVQLLKTLDLVQKDEAVAVDSMPVEGAGQVLDTFNLLAAGIRQALRRLAQRTAESTEAVAKRLGLLVYLGRSIKGQAGVAVQWESEAGRKVLLEKLVHDALRVQQEIQQVLATTPPTACEPEPTEPEPELGPLGTSGAAPPAEATPPMAPVEPETTALHQAAAQLGQILEHDVERSADGKVKGIRQVPAGDRLISITDPDMRHGRKSKSVIIAGYKVSVMASLLFGFILLTRVMRANQPDGQELPSLLDRLRALGLNPRKVLGDHAYGTLANHHDFQQRRQRGDDVELIARMPRPENGGRLTKDPFEVDLEHKQMRCPAGQLQPMSRMETQHGRPGWLFEFPASACQSCPMQKQCVSPKNKSGARTVFVIKEDEQLIRAHLVRRAELDFVALLAERPAVERVQAGLAQCGGKTVHRMGLPLVDFDVALSAVTFNLRRLGALLQQQPELEARLQQEADRHRAAARLLFLYWLLATLWLHRRSRLR
jgi:transposase